MSTTLGKLREYETIFAVNPDLSDEIVSIEVVDRLKGVLEKMGAELLREDRWGKRKLSFEIKTHGRANYLVLHYVGNAGVVEELERVLRNMEHVMRFITTRLGPVTDIEAKRAEVEKMVRERTADKARIDAERKEREDRAIDASGIV
jgi:small subunit ribosomal protein S6